MKKSIKETKIEKKILEKLDGKIKNIAEMMFEDEEILTLQNHANNVSITRMGYNDHGPVHMKKAALNSIIMFDLLKDSGVKFSLQREKAGTIQDSKISVFIASILHDIGMSVCRDNHEYLSVNLAISIIDRILKKYYKNNISRRTIIKTTTIEGIIGHMATQEITSIEAGLVLVGDGCDMEKGRARISTIISDGAKPGDIHRYSATSIKNLQIDKGKRKPIKVEIKMKEAAGLFQVEQVLIPKIKSSKLVPYIELCAIIDKKDRREYF